MDELTVSWSSPAISEPVLDVTVEDSINKIDKQARVVIDDSDGTALDNYPKGTQVPLVVDAAQVTDLTRFPGWVAGDTQTDGTVTLKLNAFDHWLFQPFSEAFENTAKSDILQTLITEYTPITWDPSQVSVVDNSTYTRDWRGASVNEAIAELASASSSEQFGVDTSNTFFFEPRAASSAPRDFTATEWVDYEYDEDHRVEVNKAVVFYGEGDGRDRVVVEDTTSQSEYGGNMGVTGGVETVISKYFPLITDASVAEQAANVLLNRNQSLQVIELTTWGGFDLKPNQQARVEIPEHGIDDQYQITYVRYDWRDDETTVRFVENTEGSLDFIKKSKQETTRIDHKNAASSTDPEEALQSAAESQGLNKAPSNPTVFEAQDMADGETRATRDFVKQGQRFELLSAGVTNDSLSTQSGLVAKTINANDGTVIHETNAKREDGTPLASRTGPLDLRFEVANTTGGQQTGVDGRWVYRIYDRFSPGTWQFQVTARHLGTERVTSGFDSNPSEQWSVSPSNDVRSSAYVGSDTVYVGTNDNDIRALATSDGTEQWSFSTSGSVQSSPAVVNDTLYVGCDDTNVYALNAADGTERWRASTGGQVRSSPAVVSGFVFAGSDDGTLYAWDAASGDQEWTYSAGGQIRTAPAVVGGLVVVGSDDNNVYAVSASDGTEQWTYPMLEQVRAAPAISKGLVFAGADDDALRALRATDGQVQWVFDVDDNVRAAPAVVDGVVYLGTRQGATNGMLYALDAVDGSVEWSTDVGGAGVARAPSVLGGQAVVGWRDGVVRAHDVADGSVVWSYDTGASDILTSPAIRDGAVYIGTP